MVGYTVNTGSSAEFADGWDRIFGGKPKSSASKSGKKSQKKDSAKAGKKPPTAKSKQKKQKSKSDGGKKKS